MPFGKLHAGCLLQKVASIWPAEEMIVLEGSLLSTEAQHQMNILNP